MKKGGEEKGGKPEREEVYRVQIDRDVHDAREPKPSARELLELAGKAPAERYAIYELVRGQRNRLELDQEVDLTRPGIERFQTLPLDQTEG